MDLRKHHRRTAKIGADCVACGCCVRVCPLLRHPNLERYHSPGVADRCVGCGKCAAECPATIITLEENRP